MKPLILVVEDDPNILKYLAMTLEFNDCYVTLAKNGKEGLKTLSEIKKEPDLIISDIMMPEMNGYDFFEAVSRDSNYYHIPFIFLSALDSPDDIRLGKMLGVDDYLTKPINEEELLAVMAGKIKRSKTVSLIDKKIEEVLSLPRIKNQISTEKFKDSIVLVEVNWDDVIGPKMVNHFPKDSRLEPSIENISNQLYDTITSIFGHDHINEAEGLLINVKNYNVMSYVFFDSYPHKDYRGGRKDYMFSIIASTINYFQCLKIKQVFIELSSLYKKQEKWDIEQFWYKFLDILTKSSLLST
ncbi:MAG: PleD family two-component system response regulator [Candidatus Thorarchaeota archaeon]